MTRPLHPTKQARSQATQDRILKATAELLRTETFDAISVRRIVHEARTSIGSFYARFRDKDALLPVLYAQYEDRLARRLDRLQKAVATAPSIDAVAGLIAGHFVDTYGEIPNLSRALFEYATRAPGSDEPRQLGARRRRQYAFLFDALLRFRDEIGHPEPERAIDLGLYFVTVTCRNRLFYPQAPQTSTLKLSRKELRAEAGRLLAGYLCRG